MRKIITVLFLLLFSMLIYGEGGDRTKILIQKIEAVDVDESLARSLEEAIVLDVGNRENVAVVTSAELESVVKTIELKSQMGCDESAECLIEVQSKLDVETLIAGKVTKLGDQFILSINAVDLETRSVGQRVSIEGLNLDELKGKIKGAIDILLGLAVAEQLFKLKEGEELNLAVMPLAARGMEQSAADSLTSILSAQLNQIKGISVISQDDIKAMLSQASMASEMGCLDSLECVVEIGASLGLSKLVTGAVGKVTDSYVVSIQLIDVRKAEVDNRVLESFAGDERELQNAIKLAAYQLVGIDYMNFKGGIDFSFNVRKGTVQLGEIDTPFDSSKFEKGELAPGRYFLRVRAENEKYLPLQTDIYVAPYSRNVKTFNLIERPTPWYKSWWFWTITGVVVVGAAGAVTAVVLTQQTPGGSGDVTIE
jgi:TolB-like protein